MFKKLKTSTKILIYLLAGIIFLGLGIIIYLLKTGKLQSSADSSTNTISQTLTLEKKYMGLMGWPVVGGTAITVLQDDSDATYIGSGVENTQIWYTLKEQLAIPVDATNIKLHVDGRYRSASGANLFLGIDACSVSTATCDQTKAYKTVLPIGMGSGTNFYDNSVVFPSQSTSFNNAISGTQINGRQLSIGFQILDLDMGQSPVFTISKLRVTLTYEKPIPSGQIVGVVKDQFGLAKPGVTVRLVPYSSNTNGLATKNTITDSAGKYQFSPIPPDSTGFSKYSLTVDKINKSNSTPPFCTTATKTVTATVPNSATVSANILVPQGYLFSLDVKNATYLGRSAVLGTWDAISFRNFPPILPNAEVEYPYLATINSLQSANSVCLSASTIFVNEPYYWTIDNDTNKTNLYSFRDVLDELNSAVLNLNKNQYYYLSQVPK